LQPYYHWLLRALHLLAVSSLGNLRVAADDASETSVVIAPGRATILGVVLDFAGQTSELSAYNNDTAYVWLFDNASVAGLGIGTNAQGWPVASHIKLAEVTLSAGVITGILDRRLETVFSA